MKTWWISVCLSLSVKSTSHLTVFFSYKKSANSTFYPQTNNSACTSRRAVVDSTAVSCHIIHLLRSRIIFSCVLNQTRSSFDNFCYICIWFSTSHLGMFLLFFKKKKHERCVAGSRVFRLKQFYGRYVLQMIAAVIISKCLNLHKTGWINLMSAEGKRCHSD